MNNKHICKRFYNTICTVVYLKKKYEKRKPYSPLSGYQSSHQQQRQQKLWKTKLISIVLAKTYQKSEENDKIKKLDLYL